jgi:hypothetical protein
MRNCCRFVFVLGLSAVLASPILAQQPQRGQRGQGGGGGGPGGLGALLQNESVQKELSIDKDQVEKVKEAVQQVQDKHKDEFAKLRDLSQEERRTKGRELNTTVSTELLKAAGEVLKPDQIKRLKQIELQQIGAQAFSKPEVQTALSLKDDQKEKIKSITEASAKEMQELRQDRANAQGNREKMTAIRKETTEKVQAVLTDDQKKAWKDLTGEPFQVVNTRQRGANNNNNQQ